MVLLEYNSGDIVNILNNKVNKLHIVTKRRESGHVHVYSCIQMLHSLHCIWQFDRLFVVS